MSKRRSYLGFVPLIVLAAIIIIHFLFWHGVWFGRELGEAELSEYLKHESPRKIQHGLVQIVRRMERGDPSVENWYRSVSDLAGNPLREVRIAAAWAMGHDPGSQRFHDALLDLVEDPEPMVRRNAALALVQFDDSSGISELRAMLRNYTILAPGGGKVHYRVTVGQEVGQGTTVAYIRNRDTASEITTPVTGQVQELLVEGSPVTARDVVALLSPDPPQVWESLRALYLLGDFEDLELIGPIIRDPRYSERIREQASLTYEAIQRRTASRRRGTHAREGLVR